MTHLEGIVKLHNPLIIGFGQDVPLGFHVSHLVPLEHIRLPECLHGVQTIRVQLPDQRHLTERANTCEKRISELQHRVLPDASSMNEAACIIRN